MKKTLVTLLVGIATGASIVAAPALSSSDSGKRVLTMRTGDTLHVPTLDLSCFGFRRDPGGHLTGPIMSCQRTSVPRSWGVLISRRWIKVFDPQSFVYQHARLP